MEKNRFKQLLESTMGNVKPLISEAYEIGTKVNYTVGGKVVTTYTVEAVDTLGGKFRIELSDPSGKRFSYDDASIAKITDTNFKNFITVIRNEKMR